MTSITKLLLATLGIAFLVILVTVTLQTKKQEGQPSSFVQPNTNSTTPIPTPTPNYDLERKTYLHMIQSALEIYRADNKVYPKTLKELVPCCLVILPLDPVKKSEYFYQVKPNRLDYTLSADFNDGTKYVLNAPK